MRKFVVDIVDRKERSCSTFRQFFKTSDDRKEPRFVGRNITISGISVTDRKQVQRDPFGRVD